MINAVIIEDSELARFELEHQLKAHPQVRVVGKAGDVDSGVALIEREAPALAFLDINLPGGNAFVLLERLVHVPQIIFTTAYEHFDLRAFDVNTIDYLLKPIEPERLARAIAKHDLQPEPAPAARSPDAPIYVKDGEQCWLVKPREIPLVEAIGNFSRLYSGAHSPMVYRALGAIEAQMDPAVFFRASRSHLVNLNYVDQIAPWTNGGLQLTFFTPEVWVSSWRKVTFPNAAGKSGNTSPTGSSKRNLPACTSCMTANEVNCLVTEPKRSTFSGVIGTWFSTSAKPKLSRSRIWSPLRTSTTPPGLASAKNVLARCSSCACRSAGCCAAAHRGNASAMASARRGRWQVVANFMACSSRGVALRLEGVGPGDDAYMTSGERCGPAARVADRWKARRPECARTNPRQGAKSSKAHVDIT